MSETTPYKQKDLTGSDFRGVPLSGQVLAHSTLTDCQFGNCEGVNFVCTHGERINFAGAKIGGATFEKADESVLRCLVGAVWNGVEITAVSGWLVTEGYWSYVTNAYVQCGCMVRQISEWIRICETMETITELGLDEENTVIAFDWWQKNSAVLIACSNDFAARG